jgi:hypothetical protein
MVVQEKVLQETWVTVKISGASQSHPMWPLLTEPAGKPCWVYHQLFFSGSIKVSDESKSLRER